MNTDKYASLPDGMDPSTVWELTKEALIESGDEGTVLILRRLEELSHLQWHTYEIPPQALREHLQCWLLDHWKLSIFFIESVLLIAYCFALDKRIYAKALAEFPAEKREHAQHAQDLEQSLAENMDPWWSMARPIA